MPIKNPDLRRTIKGIQEQNVLIPILHTELNNPDFSGFDVHIEAWSARPPDGYFHPSTQATWNARQLALYLMAPNLFEIERMELTSVFAITQGHFWHMFIQHILEKKGILVDSEVGFTDELHRRRGHMDGLLAVRGEAEGLEIKTMNGFKIGKVTSEIELKELKPEYWAQAQEYLDVFDLKQMRFLILNADYPFKMQEFVVKADKVHQARRRKIYLEAIETAKNNSFPLAMAQGPHCCGRPDQCVARYACQN
jgi:hypothetical protein